MLISSFILHASGMSVQLLLLCKGRNMKDRNLTNLEISPLKQFRKFFLKEKYVETFVSSEILAINSLHVHKTDYTLNFHLEYTVEA